MKELNVFINIKKEKKIVGRLADVKNRIFFEYDKSFLTNPLWLSPYKLPPELGLIEHKDLNFGPVFGLFDDSLPDGWGMLLMDRFFRKKGINIAQLSILDRLSFLGNSTMGALSYEPETEKEEISPKIDLLKLAEESKLILSGETEEILPQLMRLGGSPGGARPKILVGVKGKKIISDEDLLPKGFEHWIIKFKTNNEEFSDSGVIEYVYSLMAKECGIKIPETRLFNVKSKSFFGIKRFDRENNDRFHTHTLGNLIHSNYRIPECDYETLLKVVFDLTKNYEDLKQCFMLMVFNIITNNRDDHVKNFSFMLNDLNEWTLAPAYDLTFSNGPGGEHSMSVLGEGSRPGKKEVIQLGEKMGIKSREINEAIEQVLTGIEKWHELAENYLLKRTKKNIENKINETIKLF